MLDPWFNRVQPIKHWAKQAFWLALQGRVLADAFAVLFTCEEERQLARGSFWGYRYRERVVAFGVEEPPPANEAQRRAFEQAVPGVGGAAFLLFLGRIHPKKGCDLLVDAFARIASQAPSLHLVIVGPDQVGITAKLAQLAERAGVGRRVHFPGLLTGSAKWGAFYLAQGFVLPSHQENFGIAVAEAMACGVPVMISDKVNIWREVLASGGGLVEPDTVPGTEALLTRFIALSDAERRTMGVKARAGYELSFGVDGAVRDLEAVLGEAAGALA